MTQRALRRRNEDDALTVERACRLLVEARSLDEARDIRDRAKAVAVYRRSIGAAIEAQADAREIEIRAERRMGEILATVEFSKGGHPDTTGSNVRPVVIRLDDLGITKTESSRAQRLADVPEPTFEDYIAESRAADKLPSRAGALAAGKAPEQQEAWHPLVAAGDLRDAVRRSVLRVAAAWPEEQRQLIPQLLRGLASELAVEFGDVEGE